MVCMHGCISITFIADIFLTTSSTSLMVGRGVAIGTFRYSAPTSAMLVADAARTALFETQQTAPAVDQKQAGGTPLNGRAAEMQFVRSSCIDRVVTASYSFAGPKLVSVAAQTWSCCQMTSL